MRKAILAMLLAVVSGSAAAEWIQIGNTESTTIYADPATIHEANGMVKIWALFDLKTAVASPGAGLFMSSKAQYEYDCKEQRVRGLYYTLHAGNMAGGEIVGKTYGPTDWIPAATDILNESLWKLACGKK
jgi:hypothetical protein